MLNDPLTRLRAAGLLEGTTLVLLVIVAVPLKRLAGWPTGVSVVGPLHGLAFLLYCYCLTFVAAYEAWPRRDVTRASLACLLPFGTFLNDRWLCHRSTVHAVASP